MKEDKGVFSLEEKEKKEEKQINNRRHTPPHKKKDITAHLMTRWNDIFAH
jgi:hypothetical protein